MLVFFIVTLAATAILYLLSFHKYDDFIDPVDSKRYPLKKLMPVALFILDKLGYKYNTKYDRKLLIKITEISGLQYSQYYLRIHWANKITYALLTLILTGFIGIGTGPDQGLAAFGVILMGAVIYFADNELDERIKKRRLAIQMDFPDFLNKLVLLINAGMTVSRAWEKAVRENRKKSVLYDELDAVLVQVKAGKSEYQAYEDFSKRCRTPEITRFVSVLIQNLKKGNSDMVSMLRLQANECWEMRKNAAKKLGEEASTKLLFPMMIMFVAILIIVATPAILAMQGI